MLFVSEETEMSETTGTTRVDVGRTVQVQAGPVALEGFLGIPEGARGIVVFAHGSGSSRHSSRNQYVARVLQDGGLATLLFDLLTAGEDEVDRHTREHRFDIPLLAERVIGAVDWLEGSAETGKLRVGTFGSSTGAAAALIAAAERPDRVAAVVSRGGRTDLADPVLWRVRAPTLFIVGGRDETVVELNRGSLAKLAAEEKALEIVAGATHLFEEPGALEQVAARTRDWFVGHLGAS